MKKEKKYKGNRHDARKDSFELAANKRDKSKKKKRGARQEQDEYLTEYEEYLTQKGA